MAQQRRLTAFVNAAEKFFLAMKQPVFPSQVWHKTEKKKTG